ncbi:MAG TPA: hypothetical protein VFT45_24655 [Longimicrobium sp.]|nr:hypothetical protein [Longimicrobium sp.]
MPRRAFVRGLRRAAGAALLPLLAGSSAPADWARAGDATAINGSWQMASGDLAARGEEWMSEFRLWALDGQHLQAEFSGSYEYKTPGGPAIRIGDAGGVAVVRGDKAEFRDEYGGECAFALRLRAGELVVHPSDGACFGLHITVEGTYHRVSTALPRFQFVPPPEG